MSTPNITFIIVRLQLPSEIVVHKSIHALGPLVTLREVVYAIAARVLRRERAIATSEQFQTPKTVAPSHSLLDILITLQRCRRRVRQNTQCAFLQNSPSQNKGSFLSDSLCQNTVELGLTLSCATS